MKKVKIAELKNSLSRHLLYVRDGGELLVCDRDLPVARVVAYNPPARTLTANRDDYWTEERLTRLERQGIVARAEVVEDWPQEITPRQLPPSAPSAVDLLVRMRRDSSR